MKLQHLTIFSTNMKEQMHFYRHTLGLPVVATKEGFDVHVGSSKISFLHSNKKYTYHYCFLIPKNQLEEAVKWLKKRVRIIPTKEDENTATFVDWNAKSVYFYDANDNILEFIVRYDLNNEINSVFSEKNILCLNEVGMSGTDNNKTIQKLQSSFGLNIWRGDNNRFSALGDQEGLIILINNQLKSTWFPTDEFADVAPFILTFQLNQKQHRFAYHSGELEVLNPRI